MRDRPILMSAPMVLATLREIEHPGTGKTQTRRVLNPQPLCSAVQSFEDDDGVRQWVPNPINSPADETPLPVRFRVGDRLYVREAWRCNGWATDVATIFYRASQSAGYTAMCEQYPVAGKTPQRVTGTWRPGIHMPRWASRLTLIVTEVRVQRLQEISAEDAAAEGVNRRSPKVRQMWLFGADAAERDAIYLRACPWEFRDLWDSLNAERGYGWDTNPWVVAVTFTPHLCNIDKMPLLTALEKEEGNGP